MATKKTDTRPETVHDVDFFAVKEKKLLDVLREKKELTNEIACLKGESKEKGPVARAKAIIAGLWKRGQDDGEDECQRKLAALEADLPAWEEAEKMLRQELDVLRPRARKVVTEAALPVYRELIQAHVESVLTAARSAEAVWRFRMGNERDRPPDDGPNLPHVEFPLMNAQDATGMRTLDDPNSSICLWLKSLVEAGWLDQRSPLLKDTAVASMNFGRKAS